MHLGTRLGLAIALGYLCALLVLGPAPVGRFFYRLTGWTAAIAAGLTALLALAGGWPEATADRISLLGTVGMVLPAPWYVANRPAIRRRGLLLAILMALVAVTARALSATGLGLREVPGDLAAAAVAGGACFAMVFGHGYLTVPGLPQALLRRINAWVAGALLLRLLLSLAALALAWSRLTDPREPLLRTFDWLDLGVRYGAGLLLPLLFAGMVHSSLRWRNTQSATGILYASTILVWIGEAVALQLGQRWGVAL
jgi:hypothetical protein